MTRLFVACLSLILLAGCTAKLENITTSNKPPSATYMLQAGSTEAVYHKPGVMIVPRPTMPTGMNTSRIALYLDNGRRLDYYAGAQWPANLEDVLAGILIQSLRGGFPGMTVDTPAVSIPGNYRIAVTFKDFQPVYTADATGTPTLHVAATFTVIRLPEETVYADFTLNRNVPAQANSITAITQGLEGLLQDMLAEANTRIAASIQTSPKKK